MLRQWHVNGIGNLANNKTIDDVLGSSESKYCVAIELRNFLPSFKLGTFTGAAFTGAYTNFGESIVLSNQKDAAVFYSDDDERGLEALLKFKITFRDARGILHEMACLLAMHIAKDKQKNVIAMAYGPELVADRATYEYIINPGNEIPNCIRAEAGEDWINLSGTIRANPVRLRAKMSDEKRAKLIFEAY